MTFQSFLQQPFSESELAVMSKLAEEIDGLKKSLNEFDDSAMTVGLKKIAEMRLNASGTLLRGECEGWVLANEYMQNKIQMQLAPDWEDICQLNRMMTKNQGGLVREQEIYVGTLQGCPSAELDQALSNFREEILPLSKNVSANVSVLVHAALCQYWLVSMHPFHDGNGRTAILLTDWLLVLGGYLPQTFSSKIDAIVMYIPDRVTKMTAGMSAVRILGNIERSYKCF